MTRLLLTVLLACVVFAGGCRRADGSADSARGDAGPVVTAVSPAPDAWPDGFASLQMSDDACPVSLRGLPVDSLFSLGIRYTLFTPAQPDSALMCYMAAIRCLGSAKDIGRLELIAKSCINVAHIYTTVYRQTGRAYQYLRLAEKICLANDLDYVLPYVYLNMGVNIGNEEKLKSSYIPGTDSDKALEYMQRTYDAAERAGNHEAMAYSVYNMIGDFKPSPEVLSYVKRYLEADIPQSVPTRPYVATICRGYSDYMGGRYAEAHRNFAAADTLSHVPQQLLLWLKWQASYLDGLVYEVEGQTDKARDRFLALLAEAEERGDLEASMWMNGNLYMHCSRTGDDSKAEKYLLGYYRDREAIALANEGASISELDLLEKIDGYESRLSRQGEGREGGLVRQERPLWMRVTVIAAPLLVLVLVIALVMYRRRFKYVMAMYEKHMLDRQEKDIMQAESPSLEAAAPVLPSLLPGEELSGSEAAPPHPDPPPDPGLVSRIAEVMERGDEVFDPDFQMVRLCALVGSNSTYVSKALNAHYGKPFKTVLAERRVAEACRLLDSPHENSTLTIEAICHEVGFKSRGAFSVAFKNTLGITPTEYRKAAQRYMPPVKPRE